MPGMAPSIISGDGAPARAASRASAPSPGRGAIQCASRLHSSCRSKGLVRCAFIPASRQRCRSSRLPAAVIAMIGRPAWRRSARMRRVASMPSRRGICRSISTMSKCCQSSTSIASCPSAANCTCRPELCSSSRAICWLISLSSTSSTRAPASARICCGSPPSGGAALPPSRVWRAWLLAPAASLAAQPGQQRIAGGPRRHRLQQHLGHARGLDLGQPHLLRLAAHQDHHRQAPQAAALEQRDRRKAVDLAQARVDQGQIEARP